MKKYLKTIIVACFVVLVSLSMYGCGGNPEEAFLNLATNFENYTVEIENKNLTEDTIVNIVVEIDGKNGKLSWDGDYGSNIDYYIDSSSESAEEKMGYNGAYVFIFHELKYENFEKSGGWLKAKDEFILQVNGMSIFSDMELVEVKIKTKGSKFDTAIVNISGDEELQLTYKFKNYGETSVEIPKLIKAYNEVESLYGVKSCYSLSYDNSYIEFDSDPWNFGEYIYTNSMNILKALNNKLGLPSYVYEDMISTSALQGRRTATANGITASWTYHPDKGLEVMYIANNG